MSPTNAISTNVGTTAPTDIPVSTATTVGATNSTAGLSASIVPKATLI